MTVSNKTKYDLEHTKFFSTLGLSSEVFPDQPVETNHPQSSSTIRLHQRLITEIVYWLACLLPVLLYPSVVPKLESKLYVFLVPQHLAQSLKNKHSK